MLFWWPLESEDQIYIVLCWNALAKLQNARIASHHPALVGNCPTFSHVPWTYQSTKRFFISMFHIVFGAWDSAVMREVPFEQKIYMKCMYVNALKNLAKMTRIPYVFGDFPKNRLWWKNRKASSVVYVNHHCRFVNASGNSMSHTTWKVSRYRFIPGPYFPVFSPNTGKYGPKTTPYFDIFHTVSKKLLHKVYTNLFTKVFFSN